MSTTSVKISPICERCGKNLPQNSAILTVEGWLHEKCPDDNDSNYSHENEKKKQNEQKEKEQKEREQKEREQREREQREREQREREQREREQREKEQREKEQKQREREEKEEKEKNNNNKSSKIEENYIFGEILGTGAFGEVLKSIETKSGQIVAIKQIQKKKLNIQAEFIIKRESEIMKKLSHKNIVKLIESFETDSTLYLVLEFIEGGELMKQILKSVKSKQFFTEKQVSDIIFQILKGIEYVHQKNIAHRDLKPQNILVMEEKFPFTIKIADWGLSKEISSFDPFQTSLGTPLFMAPEFFQQSGFYDGFKVDVWAIGCIFYILLCGYPPFEASGNMRNLYINKLAPLKFPYQDWNFISSEGKNLISKMLISNPKERLSSKECLEDNFFKKSNDTILQNFNSQMFFEMMK